MILADLLDALLPRCGALVLHSAAGAMELRAPPYYVSGAGEWLTVYQEAARSPRSGLGERASHLHIKATALGWARVVAPEGKTPYVAFWAGEDEAGEPPLTVYFPSFWDWGRGKAPIPENRAFFAAWVAEHGDRWRLGG